MVGDIPFCSWFDDIGSGGARIKLTLRWVSFVFVFSHSACLLREQRNVFMQHVVVEFLVSQKFSITTEGITTYLCVINFLERLGCGVGGCGGGVPVATHLIILCHS